MLFNSFEFLFAFLPVVVLLVLLTKHFATMKITVLVLVASSLFFYGWWNPSFIPLILLSIFVNYSLGRLLSHRKSIAILTFGVCSNLIALAYYKYSTFIIENINVFAASKFHVPDVILPLAISFFTFQQIAYLVDSYKSQTCEKDFLDYSLFITFFPQLIAGPIVHHKDMLPQFKLGHSMLSASNFAIGISIFAIGLFKKTVLADSAAVYSNEVFGLASAGQTIDLLQAWGGALAYTFQLYFDFSGYSDMAIGLARLFGIILPLNFYSPYKATNISEFWRRWHMTLSMFLRDYVYIPLGGNRNGVFRRYRNLFATMLLGGIWHGAGWNFLIWGGLHGLYLSIHHFYSSYFKSHLSGINKKLMRTICWTITFVSVVIGWVFFRAESTHTALSMLSSMFGLNGVQLPIGIMSLLGDHIEHLLNAMNIYSNPIGSASFLKMWAWNLLLLVCVLFLPNTQDIFSKYQASLSNLSFSRESAIWPGYDFIIRFRWGYSPKWAMLSAIFFSFGVLTLSQVSEFLYFQF